MRSKYAALPLAVGLGILTIAGCSTTSKQARWADTPKQTMLGIDYKLLVKGQDEEALRIYKSSDSLQGYKNLFIDVVLIEKPKKASAAQIADLQKLATNFQGYLQRELGQDYTLATKPGPGTLRLQTALYEPGKRRKVLSAISSVMPIGIGLSVAKDFVTGKPSGVGELTGEAKLTDSETGNLFAAALDRRVGTKYSKKAWETWGDANESMEYWAKKLRYRLCTMRDGTGCVKP